MGSREVNEVLLHWEEVRKMELKTVSKWLVVLGGLQVGLMGAFNMDLLGSLLGSWPFVLKVLYGLVGAASLWGAYAMLTKKKK